MAVHRTVLFTYSALLFISLVAPPVVYAQRLRPTTTPPLPAPKSVLGFTPGDDRKIADWSQITDYFSRQDQASNRVTVQTIGQSTLKRPMIAVFISARENIMALNKYKEIQRKLADPRTIANDAERDRLLATRTAVVTISCSIHSSEIVASQMSMQLGFELATAQDPDTNEI